MDGNSSELDAKENGHTERTENMNTSNSAVLWQTGDVREICLRWEHTEDGVLTFGSITVVHGREPSRNIDFMLRNTRFLHKC